MREPDEACVCLVQRVPRCRPGVRVPWRSALNVDVGRMQYVEDHPVLRSETMMKGFK